MVPQLNEILLDLNYYQCSAGFIGTNERTWVRLELKLKKFSTAPHFTETPLKPNAYGRSAGVTGADGLGLG